VPDLASQCRTAPVAAWRDAVFWGASSAQQSAQ
jgi:hypothetical protein